MAIRFLIICLYCFTPKLSIAQQLLTQKEAIKLTLENNLGIKIAKNEKKVIKNNQSLLNSGFLPSVTISSGINYNINNSETTLREGDPIKLNGIQTSNNNIVVSADYVVFDGLGRLYNYKKFKTQYQLSEIDTKIAISDVLIQLTNYYYKVAETRETIQNLKNTLEISKDRWKRIEISKAYGQKTGLDLLNAEVDINTDSINLLNAQQQFRNAKRDLNLVMNIDADHIYKVDTTTTFLPMSQMLEIYQKAEKSNFTIQKSKTNVVISRLDYKSSKTSLLPKVSINSSYNIRNNKNSPVSFVTRSSSDGISYGAGLSWNIFDTGKNINKIRNSKISYTNTLIKRENVLKEVYRDIESQWETYLNNLYVYKAQLRNVDKNRDNFERSTEKYRLGQITSLAFRTAQTNLFESENAKNIAKYNAKKSEIQFLYTAGQILEIDF